MSSGASACFNCGERDHKSSQCPILYSPLTPGFYTGGGGGGSHSHDDESSKTKINFGFFDISNKLQRIHNFFHCSTEHGRATVTQPNTSVHETPKSV